jgi:hypothetical protein
MPRNTKPLYSCPLNPLAHRLRTLMHDIECKNLIDTQLGFFRLPRPVWCEKRRAAAVWDIQDLFFLFSVVMGICMYV